MPARYLNKIEAFQSESTSVPMSEAVLGENN
jgi:hypothetical protein